MRRHAARRAVTAAGIAIVLGSCGGGGGAGPSISIGAAQQLRSDVDAVRAAVTSGDREQAVQAIATLQSDATQLQHQGQVSADRAVSILGAAADVEAQLGLMPTTTTTVATTTTTVPKHKKDHGGPGGD